MYLFSKDLIQFRKDCWLRSCCFVNKSYVRQHSSQRGYSLGFSSCWQLRCAVAVANLCCFGNCIDLITSRYFKAWPKFLWCFYYHWNLIINDFLYLLNLCPDFLLFSHCSRHGLYFAFICQVISKGYSKYLFAMNCLDSHWICKLLFDHSKLF